MKTSKYIFCALFLAVAFLLGCEKDNFDAPSSILSGRVVYQGQPVGVRSGGVELELWQHGYQLFSKIPVHVDQDGSFSARLFDGDYKLVLLRGNGPWADNTDSITVQVRGSTIVDVPVEPYFVITDASFQSSETQVSASFRVQQANADRPLERITLYLGQTTIVDQNNYVGRVDLVPDQIGSLDDPLSLSIDVPARLREKGYSFARVGVKAVGVPEYLYSIPQQVNH